MLRAAIKCPPTGECLRRDGRSGESPCGIHCTCAIKRAACRLCRSILAYSALVIVAIMTIVALIAMQLRQSALDEGRASAANYSAAFGEQAQRALDSVAGAMERVKQRIEADGDRFDLSQWTKLAPELAAQPIWVAATGPDGRVRAGALGKNPGPADLSAEEYFQVHRDNPNAGLFIGKPPTEPSSNQVTIQLARRLEKPGGGFAGVLVFSLDPDFLISLHRTVDLGSSGIMALVGLDNIVRARHWGASNAPIPAGFSIPGAQSLPGGAQPERGAYVAQSPLDGVTRIFDWRKVPGYPLTVAVGLGKDEWLAGPTRLALIILGLGGAAMLLSGTLAAMVVQEISNRVRYEVEVNSRAAELKDANRSLAQERVNLQELNARLMLAQQESEAASHAKSAFLANMSHELRTPLNAIIGFSEIIRDKLMGPDTPAYFEYAGDINNSGQHLLAIVNDILDLAKIEAGKVEFSESVAELASILYESIRAIKPQAKSGNVKIVKDYPPDGIQIRCDEVRLKQVFINVLSNAVKFTPSGGRIVISTALVDGGGLSIAIRDTGIGMTQEDIEAAFEKFRQIDNSMTKRFAGTGLGLPLAKQLVELHGGTIAVSSEPAIGTEVRILLPAARVTCKPLALAARRGSAPGPAPAYAYAYTYTANGAATPAQSAKSRPLPGEAHFATHAGTVAAARAPDPCIYAMPSEFQSEHTGAVRNRAQTVPAIKMLEFQPMASAPALPEIPGLDRINSSGAANGIIAVRAAGAPAAERHFELAPIEELSGNPNKASMNRNTPVPSPAKSSGYAPAPIEDISGNPIEALKDESTPPSSRAETSWQAGADLRAPEARTSTQGTWTSIGLALAYSITAVAGGFWIADFLSLKFNATGDSDLAPIIFEVSIAVAIFMWNRTGPFLRQGHFGAAAILSIVFVGAAVPAGATIALLSLALIYGNIDNELDYIPFIGSFVALILSIMFVLRRKRTYR
ncbi:MAG: ATP-binding protein [Rhodomicrobium sp.]